MTAIVKRIKVSSLFFFLFGDLLHVLLVGGTVDSESALRSAGTLLSRVRAMPPAPWPDGGPESLRSPCCGLATQNRLKTHVLVKAEREKESTGKRIQSPCLREPLPGAPKGLSSHAFLFFPYRY
ncbi:hypothetical protein PoB_000534200 [Plakobranchus ocellatus]|uniref:Secreted protein n=1 Tax=Plakobranchus ocellatus TaxID=259542 RepID=A0AAV3Y8M6_9GAST|nr:hypothetical protein PoB_000534200 [Plakobranchus ocellatus]